MQWTRIQQWRQRRQRTTPDPRMTSALADGVVAHVAQAVGGSDLHLARALHALDPAVMLACGRRPRRRKSANNK